MTKNNYILNFRKRFGWSQKKLSEYSGVSINTIQNWEYGKSYPPRWIRFVFAAIAYNLPEYKDDDNK
jgi:transcriptional regulator with XRE-family HTH domain